MGRLFSNPTALSDLRLGVVALRRKVWYPVFGAASKRQAVGPSIPEGTSCPPPVRGGGAMVTYSDLFQFCLVVIGIIGLVLQITKKK